MKTKKKEITTMNTRVMKTIMGSLVAAAMALGMSGTTRADSNPQSLSVHTLHGLYLFGTHGFNIVGGVAQPIALVEGIDFKGDGTLVSPFATVSINGLILRFSGTVGTYTVQPSGRGTLTFTSGPPVSFDIFVEADGQQVWMMETGANTVLQGTATRVAP
ncbi:MAG TPA: hypothetical protein DCK99_00905 [Blastocatellia bacterium]|nr:hypothetical protein [Blastocatellia bacterium]